MPLSENTPAPYAPTAAIASILERNRATGLPSPISKDTLSRLGVSDSLNSRTLQALNLLGLIDDDGNHTDTLKALRTSPEGEYKARMAEWLNAAYADILQYVDPTSGDEVAVTDAFRPYKPNSMLGRMVTLFTGLYGLAGIWPEDAQRAKVTKQSPRPRQLPPRKSSAKHSKPEAQKASVQSTSGNQAKAISEKALEYRLVDLMGEASGDKDVLNAIITIITYLKTKDIPVPQIPNYQKEE